MSHISPKVWNFSFSRLRAQEIALATGWPWACPLASQANWAAVLMKRTVVIRVISFFLLGACGALCQKRPSADLLPGSQFDGSNSPEVQRQEMRSWNSLPDAPSPVQPPSQAQRFHAFVKEASSPLTLGAVGVSAGVRHETEMGDVASGPPTSLAALYQSVPVQKESAVSAFFGKYLYPPLLKQDSRHEPSASGSFMDRASHAASRIFVTRDDSGKRRLNTSYFLGAALTSAAIHIAYRPYLAQSASAKFNNFGSTVGSDMGINVLHEFGPDIRQMVKGHTPKFVSEIEERITRGQTRRDVVSVPSR